MANLVQSALRFDYPCRTLDSVNFGRAGVEPGPTDLTDYDCFSRVAKRIDQIDLDGREAYAVFQELKLIAGK